MEQQHVRKHPERVLTNPKVGESQACGADPKSLQTLPLERVCQLNAPLLLVGVAIRAFPLKDLRVQPGEPRAPVLAKVMHAKQRPCAHADTGECTGLFC
eukprot:6204721-Pleurochrysis_carterae.AAC.1